jgi:membrane protein CcdC involved in cytochrome C biogenesis
MASDRQAAIAEFKRIMFWIAVIVVLMVAGALTYLYLFRTLNANTVIATTLGVFFSVVLGCGLFAAAFFSNKSGYDQNVTDVTKSERDKR